MGNGRMDGTLEAAVEDALAGDAQQFPALGEKETSSANRGSNVVNERKNERLEDLLRELSRIEETLRDRFRREITVLIADVVASTTIYHTRGDIAARAMIQRYDDLAFSAVGRHQGRVVKTVGDSVIACFEQPENAVEAAVDLQQSLAHDNAGRPPEDRMEIRIGVHYGLAIVEEQDIFGDAINFAARLQAIAGAGEVLVSGDTLRAIKEGSLPTWRSLGRRKIRGKVEKAEVFRVPWREEPRPAAAVLRRRLWPLVSAAVLAVLLALVVYHSRPVKPRPPSPQPKPPPVPVSPELKFRHNIERILKSMTLEEKVGQLIMAGFPGTEVGPETETLLRQGHLGGVILYERNIKYHRDPSVPLYDARIAPHVAGLCNSLQRAALKSRAGIPLLVAADQEGGKAIIVEGGVTLLAGAMAIGATRSEELAYQAGRITGDEMRAIGINMVLAPVADINLSTKNDIIGSRSFGGRADIVSRLAVQFMKGLHAGGVFSVAKHFPGHGDASEDPHEALPLVSYSYSRLKSVEMKPFEVLIAAGVDAIMPAHMEYREAFQTPKGLPASLCERILREELRRKLGFRGLVLADSMEMKAVLEGGRSIENACGMALRAGTDLVLVCHSLAAARSVHAHLVRSFSSQQDMEEIIAPAVGRVLALKMKVNPKFQLDQWQVDPGKVAERVMTTQNRQVALTLAKEAVTLVADNNGLARGAANGVSQVALLQKIGTDKRILLVYPCLIRPTFASLLKARGIHTRITSVPVKYTGEPSRNARYVAEKLPEIERLARDSDLIIVGLTRRQHVTIVSRLASITRKPLIVVSLAVPHLLPKELIHHESVTYVCVYSNLEPSLQAVVDLLYGSKVKPRRYLPVSIPEVFDVEREGAPVIPFVAPHGRSPS